jgi:hypothetical protein
MNQNSIGAMTNKEVSEATDVTFWISLEIPVYDFLRHHYVDAVVRETRKKEVKYEKRHVADTAPHTLVR